MLVDPCDFETVANNATQKLRDVWKAVSDPALRAKIAEIASALDEIEGDRQFLSEQLAKDEQAEWRELILSY